MDQVRTKRNADSFGAAADAYARGRPAYPAAAIDWLLPAGARRVLDLGAGTGKLARDLVGRGLHTTAVDPSESMLAELRRGLPDVDARLGIAEAIPLADGSVDAVFVAQAWHWVEPARAVPEVARVLRPGGRLCLLWNCRVETEGWTRALGRLLDGLGSMEDGSRDPPVGPPFAPLVRHDVAWEQPVTREVLVDLVASRSYVIVRPEHEREAILRAVGDICAAEPAFAAGAAVLPYVTRCSRTDLPVMVSSRRA